MESKTFLDEEGDEFQDTFGRLVGLNKLVDRMLDLYDVRKMLFWHKDTISHNELSSWFFAAAMANLRLQNLPLSAIYCKFYYFS